MIKMLYSNNTTLIHHIVSGRRIGVGQCWMPEF